VNIDHEQILFEADKRHRIYLCEYGLVHVEWGRQSLVYCPGDLIGLSFLLAAINDPCDMECLRSGECIFENEFGLVSLPYGSVQISLTVEECQSLHRGTQDAAQRLYEMRKQGYFSNQKWLPPKQLNRSGKISRRSIISTTSATC